MQRFVFPLVLAVALPLGACEDSAVEPAATPRPSPSAGESATPPPSATEEPSPSPPVIPGDMPEAFDEDVAARELPVERLVPRGDEVTGVARAKTAEGEAVVIAFAAPGGDPFRRARGFVVWRREPGGDPPWRAVYGLAHGKRDGVLSISADATDLTDDGSDDALIREETGGSGACATYRVIDLAAGLAIWKRAVCDAEIQPSPDPIGLYEVTRIYEPGDPHCCPSAIREQVLAWDGARFAVVSEEVTPL